MPRVAKPLSAAKVRLAGPGRYSDGGNLYLLVRPTGRWWVLRYKLNDRSRELGLGPAAGPAAVSLVDARRRARELMDQVRQGLDPIAQREAEAAQAQATAARKGVTFAEAAHAYAASHEAGWRSAKHARDWLASLKRHAFPHLGHLQVDAVELQHVLSALEPLWTVRTETASRVRQRIEAVLDAAIARGQRTTDNPARWKGRIASLLPAPRKVTVVQHHPALAWQQIPALMEALASAPGTAAAALRFVILTACRSGEARGATRSELDLREAVWRVPGQRMKSGRPHRVPLSAEALAILRDVEPLRDPTAGDALIFPSSRGRGPMIDRTLTRTLHRAGFPDVSVHGLRSTFRTWAGETTAFAREAIEMALAHAVGTATEQAYSRGDMLEKRRELMAAWGRFCGRPAPAGERVVPIGRRGAG